MVPGHLVVADQVIDKTWKRPNTFYENIAGHVEFSEPFCPVMRQWLLDAASGLGDDSTEVHDGGTYVCMEGPQFSTRAESHMHRAWGGDLIGMTVMPEAKLAREAEIAYALIAMPTDYDCWRPVDPNVPQQQLLEEIIGNLNHAANNNIKLMKAALEDVTRLQQQRSPAHDALALGLWTDQSKIDPEELERLQLLWGRYFQGQASAAE
jgi:5'-methylthioadenosine phosphorylase